RRQLFALAALRALLQPRGGVVSAGGGALRMPGASAGRALRGLGLCAPAALHKD
ncbi:unnamed protein product, partial [Effrenium voratum]